jgi:hypothetical protein
MMFGFAGTRQQEVADFATANAEDDYLKLDIEAGVRLRDCEGCVLGVLLYPHSKSSR